MGHRCMKDTVPAISRRKEVEFGCYSKTELIHLKIKKTSCLDPVLPPATTLFLGSSLQQNSSSCRSCVQCISSESFLSLLPSGILPLAALIVTEISTLWNPSISTWLRGGSTSQLTYVDSLHWALALQAPLVCLFFTGHSFSLAESDLFMLKCYHKQKTQKFISSSELASALSCLNLHIQMLLSTRHLTVQAKHTRHWNVPTSASSTGVSSPLQFYLVTQTKDPRVNAKCSSAGSLLKNNQNPNTSHCH